MSVNPLLEQSPLPLFNEIRPAHVEPALDIILANNRAQLQTLLKQPAYTWNNLMQPLEEMDNRLNSMWSPVKHMIAVVNSEALRAVYKTCLPKLSAYATEISQNVELYNAIKSIADSKEYEQLSTVQKKVIDNELRDFRLSGVHLPAAKKKRFADLNEQLSQLTNRFEENVLDATQGWTKLITDATELAGLPEHAIAAAKQIAEQQNLSGWLFTLEMPSYQAIMNYADSRKLREEMYYAYVTRASDQGPNAHRWDNTKIINEIMTIRQEMAQLLGFANYAEYSIATKMAKTTAEVITFLQELINAAQAKAKQEFAELKQFAKEKYGIDELQAWDVGYYSEKLCQQDYAISQEDLRPYFPEQQVLAGLFAVVNRLYGLEIKEHTSVDAWYKDVRFFSIYDKDGVLRGQFYLDLYARLNKRGGAWMDECRIRQKLADGSIQIPVTYLTCNFNPPVGNDPALFTHDDVLTLFHEFGHGLQHMLTKVDYADVSGINGIPWDAVEVASQFMENWCWQKSAVDLLAKHYQANIALPQDLFNKMLKAKNFQSAMYMMRQLEFALFDFRLHLEFNKNNVDQVQKILDEVRRMIAVVPSPKYNRFQHGFSHIFAGGYAAGYYSYKWAEVLACDAFSKFEETGIFNRDTGAEFLHDILETGGSEDPMTLFIKFRGRPPKIDALLKQNGIIS